MHYKVITLKCDTMHLNTCAEIVHLKQYNNSIKSKTLKFKVQISNPQIAIYELTLTFYGSLQFFMGHFTPLQAQQFDYILSKMFFLIFLYFNSILSKIFGGFAPKPLMGRGLLVLSHAPCWNYSLHFSRSLANW